MPKSLLPILKNKTGDSVNHHSYQQSQLFGWLSIKTNEKETNVSEEEASGNSFKRFF